jgi:hypothetical protein
MKWLLNASGLVSETASSEIVDQGPIDPPGDAGWAIVRAARHLLPAIRASPDRDLTARLGDPADDYKVTSC